MIIGHYTRFHRLVYANDLRRGINFTVVELKGLNSFTSAPIPGGNRMLIHERLNG